MVCVDQAGQASDRAPAIGDDEFRALFDLAQDTAAVVAQFTLRDCARLGGVAGALGCRSVWSGFGRIGRVGNWCGGHATSVATGVNHKEESLVAGPVDSAGRETVTSGGSRGR